MFASIFPPSLALVEDLGQSGAEVTGAHRVDAYAERRPLDRQGPGHSEKPRL